LLIEIKKKGDMSKDEKELENGQQTNETNDKQEIPKSKGFLNWVEKMGNKLPHPFWMFVWICLFIVAISAITSFFNVRVTDPGTGLTIEAKNIISGEGLRWFLEDLVKNFAHFAPFGLVLVMLMGVSIAEQSGLLTILLRMLAFSTPKRIIFPVIFIIGACGNIGSDAGVVIVPPIAALIFMQLGYHPIAGLIAGYAGATAGFTANFFIAGTDVLLAGISTEITQNMVPAMEVSATSNWYFMIASTVMLGFGGAFIVKRFTIPRCAHFAGMNQVTGIAEGKKKLTPEEKKGLRHAGIAFLLFVIAIVILVVPAGAPLRDPETGNIVPSPFLKGLVPILFFMFAIPGYFYGKAVGTIKKRDDVLKHMEHGMRNLAGYIVLMLVVAQFIQLLQWSKLDAILSVKGAEFLQATGLTGPLLFILFMTLVAFLNIFIGSGSAKWAMFAPIFIPMLAQLGYSPAFVQLLYRVGDSITNSVTPLYVYFPLLLGWVHQYDKRLGIGTVVSLLIPYAIILFVLWCVLVFVWFMFNFPIGVGEYIYL
jgi:aminobenzoyl-glutamate transport protein